ncbi:zinc-binding alcohol dehydrogenase family protein [Actinidia rufa]|uniref:Zinc-binding alcohol dehydrogenase family protein n=1 Tax=Actinidia rufa TaxID=165716 RepID=A0A7J0GI63_9ERIC|nr:zinc-binding alcohol dehydrogenase family protein [Actinidia rufa]
MEDSGKESTKTAGKPIRCRAAIGREAGEPLVIEEVMVAPPEAHEVRIRILCTSLCHSDITFWKMKGPLGYFPRIFGHEAIGVVESIGENVDELTEGDMVIPSFMADCGEWVGAAWRTADVEAGSTVAIFGLGAIGLAVAEGARLRGASRIIGVDVNPDKFEIGKTFGLTDFVNPASCKDKTLSEGWGKTVVLGVDKPGAQLSLNSFEVLHSGKILTGSLFGGLKAKSDIPILVKRYMDKELQLDEFVTHEVSFEDINIAFDLLHEGQCLRCVIWMNK